MIAKRYVGPVRDGVASALLLVAMACSGDLEEGGRSEPGSIQLEPDLVLGVLDGPEEETFGRIGGLIGDAHGRIYVLDNQANDVRVFDFQGKHLYSFGGNGEGPGELDAPCCLAWGPSGLLWIRDGGNGRYSTFKITETGADFVHVIPMVGMEGNLWAETTFSHSGQLIEVGNQRSGTPPVSKRTRFFLDAGGGIDSVEVIEPPTRESLGTLTVDREFPGGGQVRLYFHPPYGPRHLLAYGPDAVWAEAVSSVDLVSVHGPTGSFEITGPEGSGPPLSASERTRAADRIASDTRRSGRSSLDLEIPEFKPPLRDLQFDQLGRLWIELSVPEGSPRRARIYGPEGILQGEATWPGDISISLPAWPGNGEWSLGVQVDSLGVQRVVRLVQEEGSDGGVTPTGLPEDK